MLNQVVSFVIAVASQMLIFPMLGIYATLGDNAIIAVYFSAVSLARSYVIRRWFNGRKPKAAVQ